MKILVTSATGKTAQHIIPKLLERGHEVRALSRVGPANPPSGVTPMAGNMDDPSVLTTALAGMDAAIHIGPMFHPREVAIGQSLIDTIKRVGTPKFVYMSSIRPQIDDLVNHQNKLRVEAHLVHNRFDWTILQPQHYFQNIDVRSAVENGWLGLQYSADRTLGFVDLADVAEVAAKVVSEDGHRWATYELSSDEHLSTRDLCRTIEEVSGKAIEARELDPKGFADAFAETLQKLGPEAWDDRSTNALMRIFGYYDRYGITGNGNILSWLLERKPTGFSEYCRRVLSA